MNTQAQTVAESKEIENTQFTDFSISQWQDTDAVMEQLHELLGQPVRSIRRENMDKVLKYFEEKCKTSRNSQIRQRK